MEIKSKIMLAPEQQKTQISQLDALAGGLLPLCSQNKTAKAALETLVLTKDTDILKRWHEYVMGLYNANTATMWKCLTNLIESQILYCTAEWKKHRERTPKDNLVKINIRKL